MYTIILIIM